MSDCEWLSDRMPAVALGRAAVDSGRDPSPERMRILPA